ncbi:ornithine cyclodeaminase family protein [Brevibacillus laterosporus]|uniref:ornithine cyclodeaminase family protein n=1 Tax=Brevibacillus laterosporus TaxID=1465 RepID=UPI000CE46586|nr:ornithine cyclodeaminase family protein [Brevibacillus laterosporus]MBG9773633.1 ornithine cyclodeaminase [Brevibacillus laterosporus]PPA86885.1 ornithine cyclodeaminase [Brevibacillus laterosporus]
MLILRQQEVKQLLSMKEAIEAVKNSLIEFSNNRTVNPIRLSVPVKQGNGTALFMPALVPAMESLGMKYVSVFPDNKTKGKSTITGLMILSDVKTGEPLMLLDASYLTIVRTGAASGLATQYLARQDASILGVIGTGAQSQGLISAMLAVRPLKEIRLYNRTQQKAEQCKAELQQSPQGRDLLIQVVPEANQAVVGADIVITATNAMKPVFSADAISAGIHINAVGSFQPNMQEIPTEVVTKASKVIVEAREAALEETGDLLLPIQEGIFSSQHVHAELGEIAAGQKPGREKADEITLFKSVGLAVMDVVLAQAMYKKAKQAGVGQEIELV